MAMASLGSVSAVPTSAWVTAVTGQLAKLTAYVYAVKTGAARPILPTALTIVASTTNCLSAMASSGVTTASSVNIYRQQAATGSTLMGVSSVNRQDLMSSLLAFTSFLGDAAANITNGDAFWDLYDNLGEALFVRSTAAQNYLITSFGSTSASLYPPSGCGYMLSQSSESTIVTTFYGGMGIY